MRPRISQTGWLLASAATLAFLSLPTNLPGTAALGTEVSRSAPGAGLETIEIDLPLDSSLVRHASAAARAAYRGRTARASLDAITAARAVDLLVFGAHGTPPVSGRYGYSRHYLDLGWIEHLPGAPTRPLPLAARSTGDSRTVQTIPCLVSGHYRLQHLGPSSSAADRYWRLVEYEHCDMLEMKTHGRVVVAFDAEAVERTRTLRSLEIAFESLTLDLPKTTESLFGDRTQRRYSLTGAVTWRDIGLPERPRLRRSTLLLRTAGEPDVLLDHLVVGAPCHHGSSDCRTLYGGADRFDGELLLGDVGRLSVSTTTPLVLVRRRLALPVTRDHPAAYGTDDLVRGRLRIEGAGEAQAELQLSRVHGGGLDDLVVSLHRLDAGAPAPFAEETRRIELTGPDFRRGELVASIARATAADTALTDVSRDRDEIPAFAGARSVTIPRGASSQPTP